MHTRQNPYAPGSGATPPCLAGRDPEILTFEETIGRLQDARPVRGAVLLGLRGVGKTVLLGRMRDAALDADWDTRSTCRRSRRRPGPSRSTATD